MYEASFVDNTCFLQVKGDGVQQRSKWDLNLMI